ncbi:unnamed protein product [Moneuplotes crassus]|uniref:Uncharacterized protein n=1 Tax=Euplotes crassus TaxID=5936 RepID=A0AAD1URY3_EUPCR|nr:unnamed protein product [Moneuplotes crassus]
MTQTISMASRLKEEGSFYESMKNEFHFKHNYHYLAHYLFPNLACNFFHGSKGVSLADSCQEYLFWSNLLYISSVYRAS